MCSPGIGTFFAAFGRKATCRLVSPALSDTSS
jgi:hypothetical protein